MFSIIIPTYKRNKSLSECLLALNRQTDKDFFVYIVNDYFKRLDFIIPSKFDFPIEIIENRKKSGPGYCRNLAIKRTRTKYCVFLDDDCIPYDDWSEKINQIIKKDSPDIVKGIQLFNKKNIFDLYHSLQLWGFNTADEFCSTSNVLLRTSIAKSTLFDTDFIFSFEDVDFFYRANKKIIFRKEFKVLHKKEDNILKIIRSAFLSGVGKAIFFKKHNTHMNQKDKKNNIICGIKKYICQLENYIYHIRKYSLAPYKLAFFLLIDIIRNISNKVGFYYEKNRFHLFST